MQGDCGGGIEEAFGGAVLGLSVRCGICGRERIGRGGGRREGMSSQSWGEG